MCQSGRELCSEKEFLLNQNLTWPPDLVCAWLPPPPASFTFYSLKLLVSVPSPLLFVRVHTWYLPHSGSENSLHPKNIRPAPENLICWRCWSSGWAPLHRVVCVRCRAHLPSAVSIRENSRSFWFTSVGYHPTCCWVSLAGAATLSPWQVLCPANPGWV